MEELRFIRSLAPHCSNHFSGYLQNLFWATYMISGDISLDNCKLSRDLKRFFVDRLGFKWLPLFELAPRKNVYDKRHKLYCPMANAIRVAHHWGLEVGEICRRFPDDASVIEYKESPKDFVDAEVSARTVIRSMSQKLPKDIVGHRGRMKMTKTDRERYTKAGEPVPLLKPGPPKQQNNQQPKPRTKRKIREPTIAEDYPSQNKRQKKEEANFERADHDLEAPAGPDRFIEEVPKSVELHDKPARLVEGVPGLAETLEERKVVEKEPKSREQVGRAELAEEEKLLRIIRQKFIWDSLTLYDENYEPYYPPESEAPFLGKS